MTHKNYQINFDNGNFKILYSLADARKQVKINEYNAKVVTITKFWLDKNSKQKSKSIKF